MRNILQPKINKTTYWCQVMCGRECWISAKGIYLSSLTWREFHLKHIKDRSHNAQNRRSGEWSSHLFETYTNSVRPHGYHICNYAADMATEKLCPCPSQHHGIPKWKCVLRCWEKFSGISMPHQDTNKRATTKILSC